MANKAKPYYAVLQDATLFYATVENIICLKHLIINHIKLFSLPVVIQGTRGLVNLAVHIHNILFAIPKL
jgi:hypothetical protein